MTPGSFGILLQGLWRATAASETSHRQRLIRLKFAGQAVGTFAVYFHVELCKMHVLRMENVTVFPPIASAVLV